MRFHQALIAIVTLAIAARADQFANFFDDDNCSVNGGIGVDINNDGCLTEAGRGSVYIPNYFGGGGDRCLVTTRIAGDCHCQTGSFDVVTSGHCLILNKEVQSYRFIHEACGPNNC